MPHITFIHGIGNKPSETDLHSIWRHALGEGSDPLYLGDLGVTSSFVYWADLLYEKPDDDLSAYEGLLENTQAAIDASGEVAWPVARTPAEAAFLDAMRQRLTSLKDEEIDHALQSQMPTGMEAVGALERVPLPWCLKKPLMAVLLRDAHHYLFDVRFAPPGKPALPIQGTIRQRFVQKLNQPDIVGPHVVVSHSMGTIIAYDCLKRVPGCPAVDGLITLGCPLGLDEVQDQLKPGWSRSEGFPSLRVRDRWFNLFDRLDPVCGFDPELANDYRKAGTNSVIDEAVGNPGAWRHSATKYLRQPAVVQALRTLLQV